MNKSSMLKLNSLSQLVGGSPFLNILNRLKDSEIVFLYEEEEYKVRYYKNSIHVDKYISLYNTFSEVPIDGKIALALLDKVLEINYAQGMESFT